MQHRNVKIWTGNDATKRKQCQGLGSSGKSAWFLCYINLAFGNIFFISTLSFITINTKTTTHKYLS